MNFSLFIRGHTVSRSESFLKINKAIELIQKTISNSIIDNYMDVECVQVSLSKINQTCSINNNPAVLPEYGLSRYTELLVKDNFHLLLNDYSFKTITRTESIFIKEHFKAKNVVINFPSLALLSNHFGHIVIVSIPHTFINTHLLKLVI